MQGRQKSERKNKTVLVVEAAEGFFDQTVIKKLRRMAGGDTYTIIYLKMQLLSLRNEGIIPFENVEDTFDKELALKLDEATDDVQVTLLFLQKHNLIEIINDGEYMLTEAVKNMDSECDSAARMRNMRERKTLKSSQCNALSSQSAHINVTCDTEREIEKEKEIEIDTLTSGDEPPAPMDYQSIMDSFNRICTSQPKIKIINGTKKEMQLKGPLRRWRQTAGSNPCFKG